MKKLAYTFLALIAFVAILSCSHSYTDKDKLKVTVSIPPEAFLVKAIAADLVDLNCIMENGNNPESFEPSVNQILKLSDSDIYFAIGLLDFEHKLIENSRSNSTKVYLFCDSLTLLYGTHGKCPYGHHHHTSDADPHLWTTISNLKSMSEIIYNALSEIDSKNCDEYTANYNARVSQLDSLDFYIKTAAENSKSKSFIVWHPSLSYFAKEYGYNQISIGNDHKEQSISKLIENISEATSHNAHIFFYQKDFDQTQALTANEKIDARFVEINTMNENIIEELKFISDELTKQ